MIRTDISQNYYIPPLHAHYIYHTKYIKQVDKPLIYVMIASETDARANMTMKTDRFL